MPLNIGEDQVLCFCFMSCKTCIFFIFLSVNKKGKIIENKKNNKFSNIVKGEIIQRETIYMGKNQDDKSVKIDIIMIK